MTRPILNLFSLALALALSVSAASAAPAAEPEVAPEPVLEGVSADASPEMQAERDELVAQWEADARAAGLDPDKEEAKSEPESGGAK
jgi:hypothetical protein